MDKDINYFYVNVFFNFVSLIIFWAFLHPYYVRLSYLLKLRFFFVIFPYFLSILSFFDNFFSELLSLLFICLLCFISSKGLNFWYSRSFSQIFFYYFTLYGLKLFLALVFFLIIISNHIISFHIFNFLINRNFWDNIIV